MARFIVEHSESVLDPDVVPIAVPEAVFDCPSSLFYQGTQFSEHSPRIVWVKTIGPAFRIGDHLLWRKAHDRLNILAHEGAPKVPRCTRRIDDGRTGSEKTGKCLLRFLKLRVGHEHVPLCLLELRDVGPGPDEFQRLAGLVIENPETILDADVVPIPVLKPVFDDPSSLLDQRRQFVEHPRGVLRVQTVGPAFRISDHLLRGKAHDRANIIADERAGEIPRRMGRVDDRRTDREQVLVSLTGATELALNSLAPLLERLELANAFAQLR